MNSGNLEHVAATSAKSPVGRLVLLASTEGLTHVQLDGSQKLPHGELAGPNTRASRHVDAARRALDEYFAGRRTAFEDLSLAPTGTPFQLRIWRELLRIPYGETTSYGRLAERIGRRGASRAVGGANARNPIGVIIPCHRVIGADGTLTGYGGGLAMKEWLLTHEGALCARRSGSDLRSVPRDEVYRAEELAQAYEVPGR